MSMTCPRGAIRYFGAAECSTLRIFDMIVVAISEATAMRVCGTRERIGSGYGQHAGEKKSEKVTARRGVSGCAEMVGSIARVECACQ